MDKMRSQKIEELKDLKDYRILENACSYIEELDAYAIRLEHKKTKARIFLLSCEDDNKVFSITFRTPSRDSTGAAHILEHCVLCGSEKFPVKDPFIELVKGSLNTFLNAMTFSDKTMYPVASCNEKDFSNLCDVYLDSVFHPNIYRERKIFEQEGWHYTLEDENAPLDVSGVVYNEMKGVFSSPDNIQEKMKNAHLFAGHSYGFESGGDPHYIPMLSYEEFLDFHRRYYHPSNSFIYFYGNMDMKEKLEWLHDAYLSKYSYLEVDSQIEDIAYWDASRLKFEEYPISEGEKEDRAYQLSLHSLFKKEISQEDVMGMQILSYLLLDVPGASLREALIGAGLAEDVDGGFTADIRFPHFSVYAKNAPKQREEDFQKIIRDVLSKTAQQGLDRDALLAAINIYEFRCREADFGRYPKGLVYCIQAFDNWLYDKDPTEGLRYNQIFRNLRKKMESGYFENLIKEHLLDNPHTLTLVLAPKRGLREEKEKTREKELEQKKASMSSEEIREIIRRKEDLLMYQSQESSPEDLLKIPLLRREEIGKTALKPVWEKTFPEEETKDIPLIYSDIFTSGIAYITLLFEVNDLEREDLFRMSLLQELFKKVNTEKGSYFDLSTRINKDSGGISFRTAIYEDAKDALKARIYFTVTAKAVHEKTEDVLALLEEILLTSSLEDTKRIREILSETKAARKDGLLAAGHIEALQHAASGLSKAASLYSITGGMEYYHYLERLLSDYDAQKESLLTELKLLKDRLFTRDRLLIHLTTERGALPTLKKRLSSLAKSLPAEGEKKKEAPFNKRHFSHAFKSASEVNYVAKAGDFSKGGFSYTGLLRVLRVILNYTYLWKNIREKGGAYGCSATFSRNGISGFSSYRDPNLLKTFSVFEQIPEFVREFSAEEREITKYVIGAISDLDIPLSPKQRGELGLNSYIRGLTHEDFQKERDEILGADLTGIRNLYPLVKSVLNEANEAVLGIAERIDEVAEHFDRVEDLYHE